MPLAQLTDPQLQKIAPLPIPEAIEMLEKVTPETRRQGLALWLARLWHGGVHDIQGAHRCIRESDLDDSTKEILSQGLAG
ncbi:hypothetical protein [Brevifollis gellanilyticus]|uniref:Uncharacterized protein n=1 Tax=Brevifollis gellanilyticus TaxID=748831 RepID=A0A512M384_9BACT|nr:hypothetical protein [Brevifollis gellanilyticus]GEP41209.1 hypothetical protein BGE01nite_05000 [Brevifollis gellanilyticus]